MKTETYLTDLKIQQHSLQAANDTLFKVFIFLIIVALVQAVFGMTGYQVTIAGVIVAKLGGYYLDWKIGQLGARIYNLNKELGQ